MKKLALACCFGLLGLLGGGPVGAQTVLPAERLESILEETRPLVLDVRTWEEIRESGTVPGALHIPEEEVPSRLEELPRDRPILVA